MSINQAAIEELSKTTGLDEEELKASSPSVLVGSPERFVVDTDVMGQETPLTDELKANLLNPASQLVTIRDNIETTEEMGDIHKEIEANATISVDAASRAMPRFEGFSATLPIRSFTEKPSKVNYHQATSFMKEALKLRREGVCLAVNLFSGSIPQAETSFKTYRDFYSVELVRLLTEFQGKVALWKADPCYLDKQNVLCPSEVNLAMASTAEILELKTPSAPYDSIGFEVFKKAVEAFNTMKKGSLSTSSLLTVINDQGSVDDLVSAELRVNNYYKQFTCLELVETFANPYLLQFIGDFEEATMCSINDFYSLEKKESMNYLDFDKVRNFIVNNAETFDKVTQYNRCYVEMIDSIRRLYLLAASFLGYFQQEK